MCMYCKGIIGRISPTPFSMQVCIIFQVNYENCLYKKHFLSLTYLQFWSVNWIMRQMLLQTKTKQKPESTNNEIRKCHSKAGGCQSAISYTKKFTHPKQKRSSLNTFG